ncbi:MAG: sugar ABC transporter ATP-binding protein [Armatimonadetes bacterium]|nr:sugar ABC transporter ATP-binding protein [Armatimonadota bacterium]
MVEFLHISKRFPGVQALNDVSVSIAEGSCHGLVGENGAGKSTLGKVLAGIYRPEEGEVRIRGKRVTFSGPGDAIANGISMVHQELMFCENMSVAENLCLHNLPHRGPFVNFREMRILAAERLSAIRAEINPDTRLGDLPVSKQQLVQIAASLGRGANVLVFDEPTSSLTPTESAVLFSLIRSLQDQSVTCIYVTHRLEEVFELCDPVTVLRDGEVVDTKPVADLDRDSLIRMMIGRELAADAQAEPPKLKQEIVLEVRDFTSPGKFEGISFTLRKGEILGLAGLVGAGRTELAEALFGLDPHALGDVRLHGKAFRAKDPITALRRGICLIPEDRKRHGLVLSMSAKENISLPTLRRLATLGFVRGKEERALAKKYFDLMQIRAPGLDAPTAGLSGGNQQKLVLAKWLAANCDLLIIDEPTRGVDVGAKAEVHALIRDLARDGKAILMVSSDLPELLALSHRIIVLRQGRVAGEIPGRRATEELLMRLMAGLAQS